MQHTNLDASRYAAVFAEDLDLTDQQRENLGYTDGISALGALIGHTMKTAAILSSDGGQDFWPVAGAEAAAAVVCSVSEKADIADIWASAIHAAMHSGMTEGRAA